MKSFEAAFEAVVKDSSDWAFEVGTGITSLMALYALVNRLLDGGK